MKTNTTAQAALILHGVTVTHRDRSVFQEDKITKADVARYYAAVAPILLRDIQFAEMSRRHQG